MATETLAAAPIAAPEFPATELRRRLQGELQKIADEGSVLRPEWVPLLDSKRVVGTVLAIEDLFPFKLPPDKIVRKGGYDSIDAAINDIVGRVEKIWTEHSKAMVSK